MADQKVVFTIQPPAYEVERWIPTGADAAKELAGYLPVKEGATVSSVKVDGVEQADPDKYAHEEETGALLAAPKVIK